MHEGAHDGLPLSPQKLASVASTQMMPITDSSSYMRTSLEVVMESNQPQVARSQEEIE